MDPVAPSTLYLETQRLWKTTDGGDSWVALPMIRNDGFPWDSISLIGSIAVARSNNSILMCEKRDPNAVPGGGYQDTVFRSTDGGSRWIRTNITSVNDIKNI